MANPRRWAVPNDLKRMVGIVKLARYLKAGEMMERLSTMLEFKVELLRTLKTGALYRKVRSQLRYICMRMYNWVSAKISNNTIVVC